MAVLTAEGRGFSRGSFLSPSAAAGVTPRHTLNAVPHRGLKSELDILYAFKIQWVTGSPISVWCSVPTKQVKELA